MVKRNIYSSAQIEVLRKELFNVIAYLENFLLENIEDEIGWKATTAGKMIPSVISKIENKIKTCVEVITQSTDMIITIYEYEGMADLLRSQIDTTIDKLNELQDYYFGQNLNTIQNRTLDLPIGKTKSGETKFMHLVVASADDQRSARGSILQKILKVLPQIKRIEDYKKATVRGGTELPEALERFMKRQQEY